MNQVGNSKKLKNNGCKLYYTRGKLIHGSVGQTLLSGQTDRSVWPDRNISVQAAWSISFFLPREFFRYGLGPIITAQIWHDVKMCIF